MFAHLLRLEAGLKLLELWIVDRKSNPECFILMGGGRIIFKSVDWLALISML